MDEKNIKEIDEEPPGKNDVNKTLQKKQNKYQELVIYIYNVVEDEWGFLSSITGKENQRLEIDKSNDSSESYLFANATENEFIYISPNPISSAFKKYFQNLVGIKKVDILVPKKKTYLICKDLYNDKRLYKNLIKRARKYKRVTLISYATTPQFLDLKNKLLAKKINIYAPEAPEVDCAWTVNFFGSKSGIRQLAQQSTALEPDFIMPKGLICVGKFDAAKIAANRYVKDGGVVIKTNKGSCGSGVLIFRNGDLPKDYQECEKKIYKILSQNDYWERYPIVIEDLVNPSNHSKFPNIEFKILKNGKIDMLYYCLMKVTPEGVFYGLDIHENILSDRLAARIIDTGFYIAERYAAAGYRGHFDIDMIATKYNQVFVNESNTRNTGGTDVYKLALELIGKDFFSDTYIISRSKFHFNTIRKPSFNKVLEILQPVLFSKKTREGVVLESVGSLKQNELVYIIFGKNKKRAYAIYDQMEEIFANLRKKS